MMEIKLLLVIIKELVVEQVGDSVIEPSRYKQQVDIVKQIFESRGLAKSLTTYFTKPQKIVTDLESMKVKNTNMLHYLSDYIDFLPRVQEVVVGDLNEKGLNGNNIFESIKNN